MLKRRDIFRNKLLEYITVVKELIDEDDMKRVLSTALTDEFWRFKGPLLQVLVNIHTLLTADPISVMGLLENIDFSIKEIRVLQSEGCDLITNIGSTK